MAKAANGTTRSGLRKGCPAGIRRVDKAGKDVGALVRIRK
jgi:hypothetical protein